MIDTTNLAIIVKELETQARQTLDEAVKEKQLSKKGRTEIDKQFRTGFTRIHKALSELRRRLEGKDD